MSTFVLYADDLSGWREPDTAALSGAAGLVDFLFASEINDLLAMWVDLPGVAL